MIMIKPIILRTRPLFVAGGRGKGEGGRGKGEGGRGKGEGRRVEGGRGKGEGGGEKGGRGKGGSEEGRKGLRRILVVSVLKLL